MLEVSGAVDNAVDQDSFAIDGVEDEVVLDNGEPVVHHGQFFIVRDLSEMRMKNEMLKILFDSVCQFVCGGRVFCGNVCDDFLKVFLGNR